MKNEDRVLTAEGTGTLVEIDFLKEVGSDKPVFRVELDVAEGKRYLPLSAVIKVLP